ncbi:MAG TPA: hypothetical protein VK358_08140 [Longimicrobium sp.]|nr:hypothetical protein [Longimicrobium sp.]
MSRKDSGGEAFGMLIMAVLAMMAVVTIVMALMTVGALYGAGWALVNYARALRESVQPERVVA